MEVNDTSSSDRKYKSDYRKQLLEKIKKVKNKNDLVNIFKVVNRDVGSNFSENKSGIFFNLNLLSDNAIDEINNILKLNVNSETMSENTEDKIIYKTYSDNEVDMYNSFGGVRLSNQEKSILKKYKNLND